MSQNKTKTTEELERLLKSRIENGPPDHNSPEVYRRRLDVRERINGKLTYDECFKIYMTSKDMVMFMSPTDPAITRFTQEALSMLEHMNLLNLVNDLKRNSHLYRQRILVSYDTATVECEIWLNRCDLRIDPQKDIWKIERIVRSYLYGCLARPYHTPEFDFVLLD